MVAKWRVEPYNFPFPVATGVHAVFLIVRLAGYSLLPRASSYTGEALWKASASQESCETRRSMLDGNCVFIHGGWLERACTYRGLWLGLRYG